MLSLKQLRGTAGGKAGMAKKKKKTSAKNIDVHRHTTRDKLLDNFFFFFFSSSPMLTLTLCSGFQFFQSLPGHLQYPIPHQFPIMCPLLVLSPQSKNIFNFPSAQTFCLIVLPTQVESISSLPVT